MKSDPLLVDVPLLGQVVIRVGAVVNNPSTDNWEYILEIPEEVAKTWISNAIKNPQHSPSRLGKPMKEWEIGRGLVIQADTVGLYAIVREEKNYYWLIKAKSV